MQLPLQRFSPPLTLSMLISLACELRIAFSARDDNYADEDKETLTLPPRLSRAHYRILSDEIDDISCSSHPPSKK